ncbi:MAG: prepilin-type N-terminal cleavage/methylation domain-containing protein [Gemmatimonadota bacterium]|nr:MAG: prepilin-type N-terminal cleavage/methylation domain-containing protein [Gemmatimonadota bacterium]
MRARHLFGQKGFTLVEVMVAMFIFGILATGITTLMAVLIQNNDFSRCMTEATTLAESKLEVLRNVGYMNIPAGWGSDEPSPDYFRSWIVEENVPQSGMKQITVAVSWYNSKGQTHSVKIYTILHR